MNREQQERVRKLRVGVFVLVALGAFLGLIYMLGARARLFEARYTIHADFTEVGGLAEGATVRLAGVQIGRVTGVHLPAEPGGKVRIDMSIAKQFSDRIRKNSAARIETQGLLGDKIIEITVGARDAAPVAAGEVIAARDPTDIGQVLTEGAETVKNVAQLAESLRAMTETIQRTRIVEDAAETVASARQAAEDFKRTAGQIGRAADVVARDAGAVLGEARRITEQLGGIIDEVEKGKGWAHVLLYEEPVALQRLNDLIASTQAVLDRVDRGEGALGVLTSEESSAAAKRLVAAMDRFGAAVDSPEDSGLLPGLLFDPQYRAVLDDLRVASRNLRDISDRIAGGRGTLGGLVRDEPGDGGIRQASRDLQDAVANLKEITEKLNEGEGTLGALIADPTIYERLVSILEGAQRSFLLRGLLRGLGAGRGRPRDGESPSPARDGAPQDDEGGSRGRDGASQRRDGAKSGATDRAPERPR
ncbi:MAG: MCE family protein [Candidatus Rokubacteria bacterium]|nr:MCE family protein [Candidatus Rokubacteria bacterium]